jgi:hypothetical protein
MPFTGISNRREPAELFGYARRFWIPGAAFGLVRDAHMDNKVVLLCLLIAIITVLAELSPAPRREASPAPQPQR